MRLQRIQELVFHRPWLITPTAHATIRKLIETKLARSLTDEAEGEPVAGFFDDLIVGRPGPSVEAGVGHVHITGAIGIGMSKLEKTCGNTDTADLLAEIADVQKKGANRIMLHVDSPGGLVSGTPEAAEQIANQPVPVFAFIGPGRWAMSAAYYLIAGCDKIYASSSAEAGSIGVYLPWMDQTARYEAAGLKVELIKNKEGDLKGAGFPGTALTDEQRADLQAGVQQIFDDFAAFVRAHRPDGIANDTLRGQSFLAAEAKSRRLIDGVADYDAAMRTLRRFKRDV